LSFDIIAIPLTGFPSSLRGGDQVQKDPIPGIIESRSPETPLLEGTPRSFVNLPAPLYIPQVVIKVTTAYTVLGVRILFPVVGLIPLLASIEPNLASDSTFTNIEQVMK
jgi:hypothetical protein